MSKAEKYERILKLVLYPRKFPPTLPFSDISSAEFILISTFLTYEEKNNGEHITVNKLAAQINMSVPQVSRMLKTLEERELVKRETSKDCRRNTLVMIGDKGKKLFEENRKIVKYFLDKVLDALTDEEFEFLISTNQKITDIVNAEIELLQNRKSLHQEGSTQI